MRGSLNPEEAGKIIHRSIPASAGEPVGCVGASAGNSVYPRECGGATFGNTGGPLMRGLSPRVRGSP